MSSLSSNTSRTTRGRFWPTRTSSMYGSSASTLPTSSFSCGVSSMPSMSTHQPQRRRFAHHEVREPELGVVLERDAGVVGGGPDAHAEQRGAAGDVQGREREDQRRRRLPCRTAGGGCLETADRALQTCASQCARRLCATTTRRVVACLQCSTTETSRSLAKCPSRVRATPRSTRSRVPCCRHNCGRPEQLAKPRRRTRPGSRTDKNQSDTSLCSKEHKVQAG